MFGTIRKHSKWLWWVIAGLMIISFVIGYSFIGTNSSRSGGTGADNLGTIYGHQVTQQDYINARNSFFLFYWFQNHEWPDKNPNIKQKDLDEGIYLRLMFMQKAEDLGIQVSDEMAGAAAGNMLRSLDPKGQPVPLDTFNRKVLAPAGLTVGDFEHFVRSDIAIQELVQMMGMAGTLITPQEAADAYQRDHEEVTAQFVLFSSSNFLSQVSVTPAAIGQFYTNYLAEYRLPDRVQVNYVEFNLSNFLEQAETELPKTNLDQTVENYYRQYGMEAVPEAKTPEEAKTRIREQLIRDKAKSDAQKVANEFATEVFNLTPAKSDNLATVAKEKGLTVHHTAPFSSTYGPEEFIAPAAFTRTAFSLTDDEPVAGPVAGPSGYYVLALVKQLPSEIPSLDAIRDQVTQDYRKTVAAVLAQHAGTNFVATLNGQLMSGHTFASVCIAAGLKPETLPSFSLISPDLPELANQVELNQFMRIVAATPTGHPSPFVPTSDGGLIVYVQSRTPVDPATVKANLPQYAVALRRQRENEAFSIWWHQEFGRWIQREAPSQLRDEFTK